jgi:UDP-N-acetylglucosamine 1-carboxyvinyltransferase
LAGAITGGDVTVTEILPENQTALINKLIESGVQVDEGPNWVRVRSSGRMKGIRVKTMPHPGFPTDMQQPMAAALTLASGQSAIEETIYESRIGHIPELRRMGAQIELQGRSALITGVKKLEGAIVEASDLRAGAALVLAGLAAKGETTVRNVHFIDRGYEDIEGTLQKLGASVTRVDEDSAGPKEVLS